MHLGRYHTDGQTILTGTGCCQVDPTTGYLLCLPFGGAGRKPHGVAWEDEWYRFDWGDVSLATLIGVAFNQSFRELSLRSTVLKAG